MPYVPIKAAAELLGVSTDTVNRRIKAEEISAQREPMPNGWRWVVEVPEELVGGDASLLRLSRAVHLHQHPLPVAVS